MHIFFPPMCNGYLCTYVIKSDSSTFKNISSRRVRTSKCFCFSSFPVNIKLIKFQAKKNYIESRLLMKLDPMKLEKIKESL